MESLIFRLFTFFLIFLDVIIVIIDLATQDSKNPKNLNPLQIVDLVLTLWFVIELMLRIVALTPPVFFARYVLLLISKVGVVHGKGVSIIFFNLPRFFI